MTEYSHEGCRWSDEATPYCGMSVEMQHLAVGMKLCRQHALLVWSVIDQEIIESGQLQDLRAQRQAEKEHREAERVREMAELDAARAAEYAALPPLAPPPPGYVYYLRVGVHIKIGFATNLERRLASYPPDTELLAVETGTMKDEMDVHRTFKDFRASGREWYEPRPVLMDHIERVAQNKRHTWWDDEEWRRKNPASDHVVKPKYWSGK